MAETRILTPAQLDALRRLRDAGAINPRTARAPWDLGAAPWPEAPVMERLRDRGLALEFFERRGRRWAISRDGLEALAQAQAEDGE